MKSRKRNTPRQRPAASAIALDQERTKARIFARLQRDADLRVRERARVNEMNQKDVLDNSKEAEESAQAFSLLERFIENEHDRFAATVGLEGTPQTETPQASTPAMQIQQTEKDKREMSRLLNGEIPPLMQNFSDVLTRKTVECRGFTFMSVSERWHGSLG